MPNNREIVSAALVLALVVAVLLYAPSRRLVPGLLRHALNPAILVPIALYVAYAFGLLRLARAIGLWTSGMWWGTGLVVIAGMGLLAGHFLREDHTTGLVRAVVRDTFGTTVLVVIYVNTTPFSLIAEVLLQVVATFLVVLRTVAVSQENGKSVARVLSVALALIGLVMIWHATVALTDGTAADSWATVWRIAAMALWYPVGLFPFLYFFAYFAAAEVAGSRVRIYAVGRDRKRKWTWTFRMLAACRCSLRLARSLQRSDWPRQFARASTARARRERYAAYRLAQRELAGIDP